MKVSLCIVIAFFNFGSVITTKAQNNDTLYWSTHYKLKWDDFKAIPDTSMPYEALTFSGIECKYVFTDTSFIYYVNAFFNRSKSWKMPYAGENALRHEQLHFDISALFARKLRKELALLKPARTTVKQEVSALVQHINDEKEKMQDQYDEETNFGNINSSQLIWQRRIIQLLKNE